MSTSDASTVRPGLQVGPTSEFSLFFRVKPGEGEGLRAALREHRLGYGNNAIEVVHVEVR
jgi:hypothetical protein